MKKKQFSKTLTGTTGKDLISLMSITEKRSFKQGGVAPSSPTEITLFDFWKALLGHDKFDVNDDFFQAGGNSLKAIQLLSRISSQFSVHISLTDIFLQPTILQIARMVDEQQKDNVSLPMSIEVKDRPAYIPLSFNQERLWFIDQLEGSVQYHIPAVFRLKGKLNKPALAFALKEIISRHEVLRSIILEEAGQGYQSVQDANGWRLSFSDVAGLENDTTALQQYIQQLINTPFNLSKDYLLRAELISIDEHESMLVVTQHHIASDGWSTSIIVRELIRVYKAFEADAITNLEPLPVQYADYSIWQRQYLQGIKLDEKLAYWKRKLENVMPLQMPTDFARSAVQSFNGACVDFTISKESTEQLRLFSQGQGVTIFMALLAAFKVLLFRYTGQSDIAVGTAMAGRQQKELEGLIGFFVNTLVLRSQVSNERSFAEFLDEVKTTTLEAFEHQEVPFEKVVEAVVRERDLSRTPLFQAMFVLQNTPDRRLVSLGELILSEESFEKNKAKYELDFSLVETEQGLLGSVEYCTDLYTEQTIIRMLGHFNQLLDSIVKSPGTRIDQLPMLSSREELQLLVEFNDTQVTWPADKNIVSLFEGQVVKFPANIAVVFENAQLTYQQLNERSNQLAHYLIDKGVKADTLVPICIERSLEMIVGILGILKAGAAYVPIDPAYPVERIQYMVKDTAARVVLVGKDVTAGVDSMEKIDMIVLDGEDGALRGQPNTNLQVPIQPHHLAYVIYTSGSTGKPKGVMIEHRNVVRLFKTEPALFDFNEKDVWSVFHSFCFDFSVWEMYGALFFGGKMIVVPRQVTKDVTQFAELLLTEKVTVLNQTPSAFYVLQDVLIEKTNAVPMQYVIFGGEALNPANLQSWKQAYPDSKLINMYGITETTVHVTFQEIEWQHTKGGKSIIGKPIPTLSAYILDPNQNLVPVGVAGELMISGAGLARGYLNRPDLTAEKFVEDPFSIEEDARMYRTGDLGRWLANGTIEYLGRIDEQVKIRGYRIELGEIEACLSSADGVKNAKVIVLENESTFGKKLCAYLEIDTDKLSLENSPEIIKQFRLRLEKQLPDYMIPSNIILLDKFPLTSNGKIDKKALPIPENNGDNQPEYEAPRTTLETALVHIWEEMLGKEKIGIRHNFFELGGHSLMAMRVKSAVRKELQIEMDIKKLFLHPTIADLAIALQANHSGLVSLPIIKRSRPQFIPLSFSQERLWVIDRLVGSLPYHVPAVLRLKGDLNKDALAYALQQIVNRHEVLRTIFPGKDGKAYQLVTEKDNWQLGLADGTRFIEEPAAAQKFIRDIIREPFDLTKDSMLRATLISLDEKDHLLAITLHHIASDAWSQAILIKEVLEFYNSFEEGRPPLLPLIEIQYADYTIWQLEQQQNGLQDQDLAYWKTKLEDIAPQQLPADFTRPATRSTNGASYSFVIGKELSQGIQDLSNKESVTLFMVLLAAFKSLLYRYSNVQDICVGTSIANRTHREVEELIGFFVNTLALRTQVSSELSFTDLLHEVKSTTLEAYEHQDTPFEKVVEAVTKERDISRSPLFQVMLVMPNTPDVQDLRLGEMELSLEAFSHNTSKFDITFFIVESANGLQCTVEYSTDLYREATIQRMTAHFETLLASAVSNPHQKIGILPMLTEAERQQLLGGFNESKVDYPTDKTIVDLFEEQVTKTPLTAALVFEGYTISYQELNERANQLAHYLRSLGVKEETLVPVCMDRGLDMIIAIIAILKSGAAYVPIDPGFPAERIEHMLNDTASFLLLSNMETRARLAISTSIDIIEIDSELPEIGVLPTTNINTALAPSNAAYVIYTSGSTGKPKGVIIEHRNLVDYVLGLNNKININDCKSFALVSTIATDLGNTVIYASLLSGGTLHLFSKETTTNVETLHEYFATNAIECLKIVPSHWNALSMGNELLLPTKMIIFGGEALRSGLVEKIWAAATTCKVINHYGPTETTIGKLLHIVEPGNVYGKTIPIGKPFSNTTVYVLSKDMELCPVGVAGQLFIAGDGVARGYFDKPEITKEKFIKDPFTGITGSLMYNTGDLVKYLPDGNIEFIGRVDDQVKIRGYRVELGEIETVISHCELVKQCVVIAHEDEQGNKRLVGYIVSEGNYGKEEIKEYLKNNLPDYMVPAVMVELESLPLTANGKVDRKALPDPDGIEMQSNEYAAPRNAAEKVLAEIWQELLDIESVGIHDNFFELGGDSIITIQLVSRARRAGYELQMGDVFTYQTIARLSALLDQRTDTSAAISGEQFLLEGASGLLPIQQWYFEKKPAEISYFNQSVLLTIDKSITESLLKRAIEQLTAHHDALRFKYYKKEASWYQVYEQQAEISRLVKEDLQSASPDELPGMITKYCNRYQQSLNIEKGELIRVVLMQTPSSENANRLLLVVHHLAIDGVSWRILLEDLQLLINGLKSGGQTDLGAKSSSYRQWYEALERYGQTKRAISQKVYWDKIVKNYRPLPTDKEYDEVVTIKDTRDYSLRLGTTQTRNLTHEVARAYHTEINDILIAALAKTFAVFSSTDEVVIGMEGHGRENILSGIDISRTAGWFTTHYPVLLQVDTENDEANLVKSIKEQLRKVPEKGIGFGVLKYINKEEAYNAKSLWDIVFNYLGQVDNVLNGEQGLSIAKESSGAERSPGYVIKENLAITGMVQGGQLVLNWTYSEKHYDEKTIIALAQKFQFNLELLITHCLDKLNTSGSEFTPADYRLSADVSYPEMDNFLNEPLNGKPRKESVESIYRLSGLQQGMLFHGLYEEGTGTYMRQFGCDLIGVQVAVFNNSWKTVMKHHSIFRSSFHYNELSIPVQVVNRNVKLNINTVDYRGLDKDQQEAAVSQYAADDQAKGFDFSIAPLMRIALIRLDEKRYRMLWTWHHILFDGWSMPVLMEEFLKAYELIGAGQQIPAVEEDRYEDYIRYIENRDKDEEESYWRNYLQPVEQSTYLPFITSTSETSKAEGVHKAIALELNAAITARLESYAQQHHVTINTIMQGVWAYLLHRYTSSNDIVFGVTVSGRPDDLSEVERRVGMFINTIPIYSGTEAANGIVEYLQGLQNSQVASRQYQYTPLQDIQKWLGFPGGLFDSILVFENYPLSKLVASGEFSLAVENVAMSEQTNFPLSILIGYTDEINIRFSYNSALLDEEHVSVIRNHFEHVLSQIIVNGQGRVSDIELLTKEAEQQLLTGLNDTAVEYPLNKTIVNLFEEQVSKTPEAIAVVFEERQLSYQQLNERANQLTHYLLAKGVKEETLVPICLERSLEMIIAIWGVLKAGAAYVPIDPEYPHERISYMLADTKSKIVITSGNHRSKVKESAFFEIISLDTDWRLIEQQAATNPGLIIKPDQLAYVIYTSGSTGKPKGAMNEHRGIMNRLCWAQDYFNLTSLDSVLQKTTYCFDVSVWELLWPSLVGSRLVFAKPGGHKDNEYLRSIIESGDITVLHFVPSMLEAFLSDLVEGDCKGIKKVLCSGEALKRAQVELFKVKLPHAELHNLYGPTEAAIDVTYWSLSKDMELANSIPIGKPVANTSIYILDNNTKLMPLGVPGEIHIGGVQVGRGYLNLEALTSQKFITDPFNQSVGSKMYKTGDLGRWLPDGNIEYFGRIDDQVKIRGFRIELGEIENVLQQSGLVRQAVVLAREHYGNKRLVGYIVPEGSFNREAIVDYLSDKLPEYMVPAFWVELQQLPLTPNGKIDKKSLPEPETSQLSNPNYVAPRNELEQLLANTWQDLLHVERVGINDNFFELGGDSIMTIQIVSRMRRAGYQLKPKDIYIHQTIAKLATANAGKTGNDLQAEQGILTGASGLLPIQQMYFEKEHKNISFFNQFVLLEIHKSADAHLLAKAVEQLMIRHDALRFKYQHTNQTWQQAYGPVTVPFTIEDLQLATKDSLANSIIETAEKYQWSLDIEKGELIRVVLMQTSEIETNNRLLIVIHHLAVDGVSWRILLEDMDHLLTTFSDGQKIDTDLKSGSFRQWYNALKNYGKSKALLSQAGYWQKVAESYTPFDFDKKGGDSFSVKDTGHQQARLTSIQTRQLLQDVPRAYHTEVNDILLSALSSTLCEWSRRSQVVIGLEGHGREDIGGGIDISRTVGWFTSLYPVKLDGAAGMNEGDLIKTVKEQLRQVKDKGLGYGVLKYINQDIALQGTEPWDIIFNYLGQLDDAVQESKWLKLANESAGTGISDEQIVNEKLTVNCFVKDGELVFNWRYSTLHLHEETVKTLASKYIANLEILVAHCLQHEKLSGADYTPSDFGLSSEISVHELDNFLKELLPNNKLRKESIDGLYRLSGLQQGMLFHGLYDGEAGIYLDQFGCDLVNVDLELFKLSWDYVLKSHSILRSAFYHDTFSIPVQCVYNDITIPIEILDYRSLNNSEQLVALKEYAEADRFKGFDFKVPPLMRLALIRLTDGHHRMLWTWHHILLDGWSKPLLMMEFLNAYELLATGKQLPSREADRYEDFIRYIERSDGEQEEKYWRNYMEGVEQSTLLPFIGKTSERTKGVGESKALYLRFDDDPTNKIQNYAQQYHVTANTIMQGVWSSLLHRYTGNDHIVFGVIVSGRPDDLPNVEQRVGLYINTMPLHTRIDKEKGIVEWLQEIQAEQVSSRQYQHTPFNNIQSWTGVQGELFDSILVFANYPFNEVISSHPWKLRVENIFKHEQNNLPLTITISGVKQLAIEFRYNTGLLDEESVEEIMSHFEEALQQLINKPQGTVSDIELLTPKEQQQLLVTFNNSQVAYPNKSIVDLFEEQVEKTPDNAAVIFQNGQLTFQELNERSNQLARHLKTKGVVAETLVPMCIDRGLDMMVAMLGILKAGGAYVPVDVEFPEDRINYMLSDTGSSILLSSKESRSKLPINVDIEIIEIDGNWATVNEYSTANLPTGVLPANLAYVSYTSGSTGKPKGVMIEHRSLVDYVAGLQGKLQINQCRSFALVSTMATDLGNTVIFSSLLSGAALHIFSKEAISDAELLHSYFRKHTIDCLKIVPSHWKALCIEDRLLLPARLLVFGGEALQAGIVENIRLSGAGCRVINHYGPTETTIGKLLHIIEPGRVYGHTIPVGKPFSNTQAYILSQDLKLCPVGVPGQLYLAGDGVARGYFNNPDLTKEKFIANPFSNISTCKMYGTGDLVKYLPDGNIEFIGRVDDQVKIRGYRIELGEIESILQQSELVNHAVVLVKEDKQGNKRLVAYVVPEGWFEREEIVAYLKEKLPDYMVPAIIMELETLPLTANGKVDRKALPDPDATEGITDQYVAPRNDVEIKLAEIWQEVLDLERVGIHDNFFELGGDSIISIQVVSRARRSGCEFQVGDVFTYQTIASLVEYLEHKSERVITSEQLLLTGAVGLLPIQQWYFEKQPKEISHFNQSVLLAIDKSVTENNLRTAVQQLVMHHDALRFRYHQNDGVWQQEYGVFGGELVTVDFLSETDDLFVSRLTQHSELVQQSLDIKKGELIKFELIRTPVTEPGNRLLIVIHHLAIDGVSWRILLEDLELLLAKFKNGEPIDLGKKSSSYRQWYDALGSYSQTRALLSQTAYWEKAKGNYCPLPLDKAYDGIVKQKDKGQLVMQLGTVETKRLLQDVPRVYHTEINDVLLCALAQTISQWSGYNNVVVGLEGHGREAIADGIDTSRTVGWFTTHYPLQLDLADVNTEADLIKSVKEQIRQVPDKGLGYGVLKYINKLNTLEGTEPWDIIFNYLGQLDNVVNKSKWLSAAKEPTGANTSDEYPVTEKLWINAFVGEEGMVFNWSYSNLHYNEVTIQQLATDYLVNLQRLISHCMEKHLLQEPEYTPSDFGLGSDISYNELDNFLNESFNGKARKESLESIYKLSGLQQGMLFHGLYDETGAGYINHFWCDLIKPNLDILTRSWSQVLQAHTILRSAFYYDSFSTPVQVVYKDIKLPIEVMDYQQLSAADQLSAIRQFEESDRSIGFDFKSSPLMRIYLLKLDENRYRMLWSSHHILFDGWSRSVMMGEFLKTYGLLVSGQSLPQLEADRYEDYISYIGQIDKTKEQSYWKNYLRSVEKSTLLPFISNTMDRNKGLGLYGSVVLDINKEITLHVEAFTQRHRITMNTLMQGVWSYLLHHYTGSNDVVYGVIVSGRPDHLPHVEQRVGLFINALPLYSGFRGEQEIVEWLQGIQTDQLASRQYQYTPLREIQAWTGVQGDLFDSLLVFENYPVSKVLADGNWGLKVENVRINEQTNYPLSLIINHGEEINIDFSYNSALLQEVHVKEMCGHFEHVLLQFIAKDDALMRDVKLITRAEEEQLIYAFNDTRLNYPKDKTIVDLIEEQVAKYPDNIAVVFEREEITYQQLNERSNQLAHYLKNSGVTVDSLVPLCLERNIDMIIGIVGILKAGGAYVPIDPEYPAERIQYMIEDTGSVIVVAGKNTVSKINPGKSLKLILLDENAALNEQPTGNLSVPVQPHHLAYVIYTSGSTGKPKGVMIEHRNVVRLFKAEPALYDFNEKDVWSVFHSFCFDFSVWEMYGALFYGGKMVVVPGNVTKDVTQFAELLLTEKVTVLSQTPSAFYVLQELLVEKTSEVPVRYVVFGGEALNPAKLQPWKKSYPESKLINMYGITETTVHVTYQEIEWQHTLGGKSIIGKPIPTLRAYILDTNHNLVPVGVAGELMISGAGLARGYLNRPDLTAEKFVNDPFSTEKGTRMYRTGDLGRWLPDGNIEYLGRIDEQVKIRGYRIELGEIESVLHQSELLSKVVVLAKQDKAGNKRLVAYVVPKSNFQREALVAYLKTRLPEYMVPALWVEMEDLPLTANGKIDRKALPDPEATELLNNQFVAPRNELETKLADIWKEILLLDRVGIYDNFFELGGHSLLVMKMISSVKRELKIELALKTFFELLTIEALASYIAVTQTDYEEKFEDYDTIKL